MFSLFFGAVVALSFSASAHNYSNIKRISNDVGKNLNFNYHDNFDFNGDGVKDKVRCSSKHFVKIINGKNNKTIYSWAGPPKTRKVKGKTHNRAMPGCEIVRIPNKKYPLILPATFWNTHVWRANSDQWVIFYNYRDKKWTRQAITVNGFGKYRGVVRSVKCRRYPGKLVKKGYRHGALCFYSDYTADYTSRSALLKLEYRDYGSRLIAKDLTGSSGLHWRGGARGTSIWTYPVGYGWANNQRDGAFMMDSAWFDFNKDGLMDFMTVGQHASVRAHKMVYDSSKPEGIRYQTYRLTSANRYSEQTEFLKASALNRINRSIDSRCAYLSGEREGRVQRDHLYCFKNGSFNKINMPGNFNSEYYNARIQKNKYGNLIIKTRRIKSNGYDTLTFKIK